MNRIFKYYKGRKGITLVWMAFMLAVLLMLAGLAIDIAYMYYVKNQLQVAADAAALAGAANLGTATDSNTSAYGQLSARQAAWKFACKNRATNQAVFLVTLDGRDPQNPDCDTLPTSGLNEDDNESNEDIVVGHWRSTTPPSGVTCEPAGSGYFCPATGSTGLSINALKAGPRMTGESGTPMPRVRVFIGQIFSFFGGAGWPFMSARASAIASRAPLATPGIPLCVPSCNLSVPHDLIMQKDPKKIPINDGMAWTAFDYKQAPNIGKNGDVVDYIWGRKKVQIMCDLCITTNNAPGEALKELDDAFTNTTYKSADKDFDSTGKVIRWRVAVPIIDMRCNPDASNLDCPNPPEPPSTCPPECASCACPPGGQGNTNERYHIQQIAEIAITSVNTKGSTKGITIDDIGCVGCPTSVPLGKGVTLVK